MDTPTRMSTGETAQGGMAEARGERTSAVSSA